MGLWLTGERVTPVLLSSDEGRSTLLTSWSAVEAQSEWPHSIKKSAQTYIYQIKALEQQNKVTTVPFRQSGLQKKYGTKHVFWALLGELAKSPGRNFVQSGPLPIFQLYKHLSNCPYGGRKVLEVPDFYKGMC